MTIDTTEAKKRMAALAAAAYVEPGQSIGLGTGSTAKHLILWLASQPTHRNTLTCVATSLRSLHLATAVGLRCVPPETVSAIDICIDGADQIDKRGHAIKGGGGCFLLEKLVARKSSRNILIAHEEKVVDKIGSFPIAIEVVQFDHAFTATLANEAVSEYIHAHSRITLRMVETTPFVTDSGNYLYDLQLPDGSFVDDPKSMIAMLSGITGILDCGLFPSDAYQLAIIGRAADTYELIPS